MDKVIIKKDTDLSTSEIRQINEAMSREFNALPTNKTKPSKTTFFLLEDNHKILAVGGLISVEPVYFEEEQFSIMGIGGIVANEKRKGYGKQIMTAIINYLSEIGKTGVGFCGRHNKSFYEKCGLRANCDEIKRFVFRDEEKIVTNKGDDCVIYFEGKDGFMEKVLSVPGKEIHLPRKPDW